MCDIYSVVIDFLMSIMMGTGNIRLSAVVESHDGFSLSNSVSTYPLSYMRSPIQIQ